MKKFKKIFAVLLTLAMVLGMSVTVFATDVSEDGDAALPPGTIQVNNAEGATLTYVQLVKPNQTKTTGWELTEAGRTAFNINEGADDQGVIWRLIKTENANAEVPDETKAYSGAEMEKALNNVKAQCTTAFSSTASTVVDSAGVYAVKAVDTTEDSKYTFSMMSAYISFTYNENGTASTTLGTYEINAKKQNNKVTKTSDDNDGIVYVGKQLTYTINAIVPYFTPDSTNNTFTIEDTITGATFDKETSGDNAGKVKLSIKVGKSNVQEAYVKADPVTGGEKITIDLMSYITNATANDNITITYTATVTGTTVTNTATPNNGEETTVLSYTGTITVTKRDGDGETANPLSGAKFKVYDPDNEKWAVLKTNGSSATVTGWVDNESDATETPATNDKGEVKVAGLEYGVEYQFKETTAPQGYSINTNNATASWDSKPSVPDETNVIGDANMTDTKLSSLPSTGGIGTTIFTIAGCAIIVVAAGLFFASRRKSAR